VVLGAAAERRDFELQDGAMKALLTVAVLAALAGTASAQEKVTVQALLKDRYLIVGTVPSSAGPGLFLRKRDKLYLCFVAETPTSQTVATQYCKPVE
jgi:hypothetical protein